MKGSQSINDLSSFPEAGSGTSTLPRSARGKEGQPQQRKPRPRSLYISAVQNSMASSTKTFNELRNTSARFAGSEGAEVSPAVQGSFVGLATLGAPSTTAHIVDGNSTSESKTVKTSTNLSKEGIVHSTVDGTDSDDTLHGDLGSSSGFVEHFYLSYISKVTEIRLKIVHVQNIHQNSPLIYINWFLTSVYLVTSLYIESPCNNNI